MVDDFHGGRNTKDWPAASPAPALPESGVEGLTAAWLSAKAQKLYQTRSVGDVEGFEAASALWNAAQCIAALATPAPAPAPAPAPVDAGGLVARLVKPLEWTQVPDKWLQFTAGDYTVRAGCWYYRDAYKGQTANEDTAKAAAQADYTARILSALDASALAAAAEREAELVRERDEALSAAIRWQDKYSALYLEHLNLQSTRLPLAALEWKRRTEAAEARVTAAEAERDKMRDAALQCLDDMGATGRSVCGLAKAELRWALGPMDGDEEAPVYSYDEALEVMIACDEQHGKPSGHREEQRARAAIRKETTA